MPNIVCTSRVVALATTLSCVSLTSVALAQPTPVEMAGATNVTRVDASVLCGGATSPDAYAGLRAEGFVATINLREPTEAGADIDAHREAAANAGMTFIHLPFNRDHLTADLIERFLDDVARPEHQPVYIHCGSAGRVGALWFVKRRVIDGWPEDQALAEAEAIGLSYAPLRDFVVEYANTRVK